MRVVLAVSSRVVDWVIVAIVVVARRECMLMLEF